MYKPYNKYKQLNSKVLRNFLFTLITKIKDLIKTREHNKTALETVRISIQNDIDHSELMLGIGEL